MVRIKMPLVELQQWVQQQIFQNLADTDPFAALNIIDVRGDGFFGISQENKSYVDQVLNQTYGQKDSFDFGLDQGGGGPDLSGAKEAAAFTKQQEQQDIDIGGGSQDSDMDDSPGSGLSSEDIGMDDPGGFWKDGGVIKMQDGGMAPQGAEADMSNLGMINEQAAQPQQGGAMSVKDDIPREADAGDYILPYETVLLVGLKDLNRYAKEAIDLAMKNGVNLKGTDLDPTDDVPIKVSNYEYHIPKMLVPFFGGGKKVS